MNLHKLASKSDGHLLYGNYMKDPQYWCSCGWSGFAVTGHAVESGVLEHKNIGLFYCKDHHEGSGCERILPKAKTYCEVHAR